MKTQILKQIQEFMASEEGVMFSKKYKYFAKKLYSLTLDEINIFDIPTILEGNLVLYGRLTIEAPTLEHPKKMPEVLFETPDTYFITSDSIFGDYFYTRRKQAMMSKLLFMLKRDNEIDIDARTDFDLNKKLKDYFVEDYFVSHCYSSLAAMRCNICSDPYVSEAKVCITKVSPLIRRHILKQKGVSIFIKEKQEIIAQILIGYVSESPVLFLSSMSEMINKGEIYSKDGGDNVNVGKSLFGKWSLNVTLYKTDETYYYYFF